MLFSIVKDPKISANDLNHDLDVIHQWANQWKLEFNPDPNKQATEVLFSCKISNPSHPQIMFNGTVVSKRNEHKHLGLLNTFPYTYLVKHLIKCIKLLFVLISIIVT